MHLTVDLCSWKPTLNVFYDLVNCDHYIVYGEFIIANIYISLKSEMNDVCTSFIHSSCVLLNKWSKTWEMVEDGLCVQQKVPNLRETSGLSFSLIIIGGSWSLYAHSYCSIEKPSRHNVLHRHLARYFS